MNSLDDKKKLEEDPQKALEKPEVVEENTIETPLDAPLLYNDVVIDASELDQDLDFKVEDVDAKSDAGVSFNANVLNEEFEDPASFSAVPAMHADQKILETRQEPVMSDGNSLEQEGHFAATDNESASETKEREEEAAAVPPKKQRKGSVLGMGWFQGFNLFICGLIFVGLAIFAYFIFGEKPLYTGKLPKYVVIENDELGSMGALNPAIPDEERQAYIYVPKVERVDEEHILQDRPVLDTADQETRITKVELQSGDENSSNEAAVSIETEQGSEPAFTLLSVDHNADGIAREDLEKAEAFIQQAEIAFMQGNYVGVDETDAYFLYQKALELDAKNRKAEQGLASIADIYYRSAYDAFTYGNQDIAKQYLMIGLKVAPNHRPLQELEKRMEQQSKQPAMNFNFNENSNNNDFGGFEFN
ncbi:hypothetical protein MMG00_02345 [Ignatzschineria rhizosphaerae]|uniref:Tetratricopeptide repeat protein n=1 Tax=Ignatzschineria rhizosphaerae TaxID=2923279 RepID=A0ABY3X1I4_9GAMM|nr:hypothetical protein [Ignatzschineria rhizosphaerae]UNM96716.1 hypothetical protein MMG00_02345 [Ignatzschineria rhizosphaerae]